MRNIFIAAAVLLAILMASCGGGGPSAQDINNALDTTLQSVAGDWIGVSNVTNSIRLDFKLQEGANGQVSGTGTMKELNAPASVPITVTGTFQRPLLTLTFDGMVYESHAVKGSAQGNYTTVGGIGTTLTMTGVGTTREVAILLQEK